MSTPSRDGRLGFTLLELLVVIALLALMAAVALPAAGAQDEQHLQLAGVRLGDALDRARALARSQRSPHAVVFDVDGDRFALVDASGGVVVDPLTRKPMLVDFTRPGEATRIDVVSADFGAAGRAALFDAQGVPLHGGTLVLRRGAVTHTLDFEAATGRLSLAGS